MRKQALEGEEVLIQECLGAFSLDVRLESMTALQAAEVDFRRFCSPRFLRSFSSSVYLHSVLVADRHSG